MKHHTFNILFVCMGNICRSPTAEGVLRQKLIANNLIEKVYISSAGTHNYHPNSPPDQRSQRHALSRGYDISDLRAKQVKQSDFLDFDLLLTMDWDNKALLEEICPAHLRKKIRGITEFLQTTQATTVPDPYYGDAQGFEIVLDLIEEACEGLINYVTKKGYLREI